jgi:hypothetical protein
VDLETKALIAKYYLKGISVRRIAELINYDYGKETIRKELNRAGANMRGRSTSYKNRSEFCLQEAAQFSELLGYLYGDDHITKNKNTSHGGYDCILTFALNEEDLIRRAEFITSNLFGFKPRRIIKAGYCSLKFRRSFAKYLHHIGYPAGKKSVMNPRLPLHLFDSPTLKRGFLRGFLNAEAGINQTIAVHQSVRIRLPGCAIEKLCTIGTKTVIRGHPCCFVRWSNAKNVVGSLQVKSNILLGVQQLLLDLGIKSVIYPIRIYLGNNGITSVHFELHILPKFIKQVKMLNLISCEKKLKKISLLLRQ